MKAVDIFGDEINPGDVVVYPNRQGSSLWMVKAIVTGQTEERPPYDRPTVMLRVLVPTGRCTYNAKEGFYTTHYYLRPATIGRLNRVARAPHVSSTALRAWVDEQNAQEQARYRERLVTA